MAHTETDPVGRSALRKITWRLMPDTEIMEMVCTENNQSVKHLAPTK